MSAHAGVSRGLDSGVTGELNSIPESGALQSGNTPCPFLPGHRTESDESFKRVCFLRRLEIRTWEQGPGDLTG